MPIVNMNDEDYAAYSLYLTLPAPIRWTVRAVVYLCRSDRKLVHALVSSLWKAGGRRAAVRTAEPVAGLQGQALKRRRRLRLLRRRDGSAA
jgi:hypothetical protein